MIQSLLKVAVFGALIQFLRPRFRGLLVCIGGIFLTFLIHAEYLSYVELTGDAAYLLTSYWVKWSASLLLVFVYTLIFELHYFKPKVDADDQFPPLPKKLTCDTQDDGYDFVRQKRKLVTRTERLLNEPRKTN